MLTISDIKDAWGIVIVVAIPIAAIIGFIVHLLTIRKSSLEIKKLQHEINKLNDEHKKNNSLIKIASIEQIEKYGKMTEPHRFPTAYNKRNYFSIALIIIIMLPIVIFIINYIIRIFQ